MAKKSSQPTAKSPSPSARKNAATAKMTAKAPRVAAKTPRKNRNLDSPVAFDGANPEEVVFRDENNASTASKRLAALRPLRIINGVDGRRQIIDTNPFPWCAICSLVMQFRGGTRIGTGWLVSRRVVITAGHCVLDHSLGGWAQNIQVIPGRNGVANPFGSRSSSKLRSVDGWINNADTNYDYGAILFKDGGGWSNEHLLTSFTPIVGDANEIKNQGVNVAGYPQDKSTGTLWWDADAVTDVSNTLIRYQADTIDGQSGGPIWIKKQDGTRIAVGVHTSGGNYGTRINDAVLKNINRWIVEANS